MNPDFKNAERNRLLKGISATVFKRVGYGWYIAIKSRHGDVLIGGKYSRSFVEQYAGFIGDTAIID